MQLKSYQKRVITDLKDYLDQLKDRSSLVEAFKAYWESRHVPVGENGINGYQNVVDGVPHVCYKVPTGGGKTFLACASVKPIFDALPFTRHRAVVWLVPSDTILSQTLRDLKNPHHPYRERLNADFGSRVEVYSKNELLSGQNFSPATIAEQLTVMVLSYDSFRTNRKDGRKAYQANGNLAPFATAFGAPEQPIEDADETALFQVINQLNPVVIVDESHHATSTLSHEMLVNFNPAFILDLTATPKKQSNIISYVDAFALKTENMVKLPVIVYNRSSQTEVVTDAIDLRNTLEKSAVQQEEEGGRFIRPIVLFQAEPKTGEDPTTFEKLRAKLVNAGIPEEQIAIKTATINELTGVNLMSRDCEIRYIITVNALKEGWDCPFAYILASLANKTSQIDVEQILGRVLRQPYATKQQDELLNLSYVLTASNDFSATLKEIISGLNNAGFSKKDFRAPAQTGPGAPPQQGNEDGEQLPLPPGNQGENEEEEWKNIDEGKVASDLQKRNTSENSSGENSNAGSGISTMLEQATKEGADYKEKAEDAEKSGHDPSSGFMGDASDGIKVKQEFVDEMESLKIPQFYIQTPPSGLFSIGIDGAELLSNEALVDGFTLRDKDIQLDLTIADEEIYRVDVTAKADVPRAFRLNSKQQRYMREQFSHLSVESKKKTAAGVIFDRVKPVNSISDSDLRSYIDRIAENFGSEELLTYEKHPFAVSSKIQEKIKGLLEEHKIKQFYEDVEIRHIDVRFTYNLPLIIHPLHPDSTLGGSLYESEDKMNKDEQEFAARFTGMPNIRWWHRNIERRGFCINGPFNHYPDFIVMTKSGIVVLVEPKGEQLKNDDSRRKIKLGQKWASLAGDKFRYYMVFQDGVEPLEGALTQSRFFSILEQL